MAYTDHMKTITITAGHSDKDPGAVANGEIEQSLMTWLRDCVAHKVRLAGHDVRTDGGKLLNLPLAHALLLVPGSDCAIELHCNASANQTATGVEVVAMPRDKAKAQRIAKAIADVLGMRLRGDNGWIDQAQTARGRLGFVRAGGMVVEVFFISNKEDLHTYQQRKWLVASAIAQEVVK